MSEDTKKFIEEWDEENKLPGPRTKKYQHVFKEINSLTKDLPDSYSMSQRLWSIKYGTPKCPHCGKESKLTRTLPVRPTHCSSQCVGKNPERQHKRQKTSLKKYGVKHPMLCDKIKEKFSSQLRGRKKGYTPFYSDRKDTYYSKKWLETMYYENGYSVEKICEICNVTNTAMYKQFRRFGIDLIRSKRSYFEEQIVDFIENNTDIDLKLNYRKINDVTEVDVFVPSLNLAIECDGLYWHSYPRKDIEYHQNKKLRCLENNINLISFFEHEYKNTPHIVESCILSNMNIYKSKLRASECEIRNVPLIEEKRFLNENHIQGYSPSSICLGLYKNDTLHYMISFGKPRFNSKYEFEMIRCCSKMGIKVYGGASKLWKYFLNRYSPVSVISYCNLRYGNGGLYNNLGFERDKITTPSYFYFNPAKLKNSSKRTHIKTISRYQAQKKNLPYLLGEGYNQDKTEYENMTENGYLKIYDAGNIRFIWNAK